MLIALWWLLVGHVVADYPLQGDFLAMGKNHKNPNPVAPWWQCMLAHSLIHGGMVAMLTQNVTLGILETVTHFIIDYGKCDKRYGFNVDQALHLLCKVVWVLLLAGKFV